MYGFFSILAICATILIIFFKSSNEFHITHTYHNHEHLDPERFKEPEAISLDNKNYPEDKSEYSELLETVQNITSIMNGGGAYDSKA